MSISLKKNVIANYLGRFYLTGLGIFSVPLYLSYMGKEAYGLVGFFALLSGWLQLLDLGLSSTLSREAASYKAGKINANTFRYLFLILECILGSVGILVGLSVFLSSGVIAEHWINAESLSYQETSGSIALMGIIFALNWQASVRRSVIVGFEKLIFLNFSNSLFATIKFFFTLVALARLSTSPIIFFTIQLVVSALELLLLFFVVRCWLPPTNESRSFPWESLRKLLGFSISIAITNSLWVFVTQTDKMILSNYLSLSDFAGFSIALTLAGVINLFAGPFNQAIMPRLTNLCVSGNKLAFQALYSETTQILTAITFPVCLTLAATAHPLLKAWTNDGLIADKAYIALILYALGNGILAVSGITYCLQFAYGDLSLHLKNTVLFALVQIPSMVFGVTNYGLTGAGTVWLVVNILSLIALPGIVHRKFAPGIHLKWLLRDILLTGLPGGCFSLLISQAIPWANLSRWQVFFSAGLVMSVGIALCYFSTDKFIKFTKARLKSC